jgi:outer membrane protein, heavy metal efflux system
VGFARARTNPSLDLSMNSRVLFLPCAVTAFLAAGCSINPRPSFDETDQRVRERTGLETVWIRGDADEAAALDRVRALLREPLTPRIAARIALLNNRALQAKLEDLGVAHANAAAAGLPGNPDFEAFIGWPSGAGESKKIELAFGVDVLDLFLIPSRKRLGALELKQAKALAAHAILETSAHAQNETIAFQALEADLAAASTALEIEEALASFAEARKAAGNLADLNYEEELSKRDELRTQVARFRIQLKSQRENVNRALGLAGELTRWTAAPLATTIADERLVASDLEKTALEQRFDVAAAKAASEMLNAAFKLQRKTRLLPAGAHVGVQREKEGPAKVTGPTIRLQLPIFNPGRFESARLEALSFQAERLLEDLETRARAEVRERVEQMHGAREIVAQQESSAIPRRKRIVDLTQAQFNMMLKGADDLLRAKRDEVEAGIVRNDALRAYWTARVDLTLALGGSIPGTKTNTEAKEGEAR